MSDGEGCDKHSGCSYLAPERHQDEYDERNAGYNLPIAEIGEEKEEGASGVATLNECDIMNGLIESDYRLPQEKILVSGDDIKNSDKADAEDERRGDAVYAREDASERIEIALH